MGFTERKHQKPKGEMTGKQRRNSDRHANGQFRVGNKARDGGRLHMPNLKAGLDPAQRILADVSVHGSRSRALDVITSGDQLWNQRVREWREELMTDLGGAAAFSVEAHEILARVVVNKIILDSLDAFALSHPAINKVKLRTYPWVSERDKLTTSYVALLKTLRETVQATKHPKGPPGWNRDYDYNPDLDGPLDKGDA